MQKAIQSYAYPPVKSPRMGCTAMRTLDDISAIPGRWLKLLAAILLLQLTITGMLSAAVARGQDPAKTMVGLNLKDAGLAESLLLLQQKSGIKISFYEQLLERETKKVTLNASSISVSKALQQILGNTNLRYRQVNDFLVIESRPAPQPAPGIVKGRIVEFETSQPLPGATVRIVERNMGMSANEKGFYQFSLPAGTYTLEVSFISYATFTQRITVSAGKESTYDIKLQGNNTLGEVVVKSRKKLSKVPVAFTSEKQLLTEVKMSRSVLSGISNEQITKMADRNAAEVVKRIAGVSVVDDKFIVVRGMNQRYNLTYLNQNVAPSTELYSRAFAYDMLPTPIIDRIVVYKSPAAELLGDYAGGAVRVYTKNTSPVRALNVGVQMNYREGSTFKDMNGYKGGKTDWLGFDDGTRRMPDIPGFRETGGRQTMTQEQLVNSFTDTWQYGRLKALPDMQLFVNYFDNWQVFGKRLYSMSALTYTNEYRHFIQTQTFRGTGGYATSDETDKPVTLITSSAFNDQSTQITKLNFVQNFTFRFNDRHKLEFNNFLLNDARDNTIINTSFDKTTGYRGIPTGKMNTFYYQQRFLYNGNLGGEHELRATMPQNLRWNIGYSRSLQDVPDLRVTNFGHNEEVDIPEAYRWTAFYRDIDNIYFGLMSRLFIKNTENVYNVSADYRIHPLPAVEVKVGTYQLYRTREMDRRFFKVLPGNFTGNETDQILQNGGPPAFQNYGDLIRFREQDLAWIWNARNFPDDGTGLKLFDVSSPLDQYLASEQNNSGYVQGEWAPLGGKIILNAGLRVEYNSQRVAGAAAQSIHEGGGQNAGDIYYPVPVNLSSTDWLPSVNFNYRPDSAWVLRASYGRTVNRPEFREIAPFTDIDFIARERIVGNPGLQRSMIDNYDLRLELYPRRHPNETVSIGIFYKRINQPIERLRFETEWEDALMPQISFANSIRANVYGLELDLRKSLAFIPGNLFRNLSVVANGALIKSAVTNDHDSGRPLQGQAPYVVNGGLFYENPGWGTKLGLIYNITGSSIYAISTASAEEIKAILQKGATTPEETVKLQSSASLIETSRHLLDFSFTQRLFRSLQLRITIQNLLNQPYRLAEDATWDYNYDKPIRRIPRNDAVYPAYEGDNDMIRYNPGRYYNITFTYAF